VQFRIGTKLVATVKADANGQARYQLSRTEPVGSRSITATFVPAATADVRGSVSSPVTVTVTMAKSATTLSVSKKSLVTGAAKTVKATATVKLDAGIPRGRVIFRVDGKIAGTVGLVEGKARYTLSTRLSVGRHRITAEFVPADLSGVRRSISDPVTVTVRRS
jgi:hypothetical protein